MKYFIVLLMSLISFKSVSNTPIDTLRTPIKIVTTVSERFLITLTESVVTRDLKDVTPYLSPAIMFIIATNDGELDMVKYVSSESAIEALEVLLDQLPPSNIQIYRNTQPDVTIFTVKFTPDNLSGTDIRVIFFLEDNEITKIILQ